MIQEEHNENDGFCKKILYKMATAANEFLKKIHKEKSYINMINSYSSEKKKKEISSQDDEQKSAARNSILHEISKIEQKYKGLNNLINFKLDLINEENKNNSFYVREEINTYAELTVDSANFTNKLDRYNMIMSNIPLDSGEEVNQDDCSLEEFIQMSKAIEYKIKNRSEFSIKFEDLHKADFLKNINFDELENKKENEVIVNENKPDVSEDRKRRIKKILKNKKYFCLLKEKNYFNLINSLRNIAKFNDVNRVFIRDLGHTLDLTYDIDFTIERYKRLVRKAEGEDYIRVYQYVILTMTTMLDKFPVGNLDAFLTYYFKNYFYKIEDKTISIYGRLYMHYELKSYVKTDEFKDQFSLSSAKLEVHRWFQDIIADNNLNDTDYVTNAEGVMMKYLTNLSKEFVILRDVYAMMIVDHYKKKNPFATVEELDN
jgi:hypothetical protein